MAKKFAFIIALIMVISCLFVLTGCKVEDYNNFTPLENNPSAEASVESNGGIAVEKGDYIYFVNGWATYTSNNIFGSVLEGSIMRILKSDMEAVIAAAAQKDAFDLMQEKAVVVVPKIFSQGNTADKSVTGFYIFGDRIYYFTPNADIDKNASPKSTEMCLNSCNLNGTDTAIHFVFKSRTIVASLSYVGNKAFCTYIEEGVLKSISLQGSKNKAREIMKDVGSALYDENGACFVLNKDATAIYKFSPGANEDEQLILIKDGVKNSDGTKKGVMERESYALVNVYGGECFIKVTGTTDTTLSGVYKIKTDNSFSEITKYVPTTAFKGAGNYLFVLKSDNSIEVVDFSDRTVAATKTYSAAPTLLYVKNGALYFTESSKLYSLTIPQNLESDEELNATLLASTAQYSSSSLQYDVCAGFVFLFGSTQNTDNSVYPLYVSAPNAEEEGKTIEYNITRLTKRLFFITVDVKDAEGAVHGSLSVKVGTSTVTNTIAGNKVIVTVTPNSGYQLKENSLKYGDTVITKNADGYTFIMPQEHITLTAEFELIDYAITLPTLEHATVTVKDEDGNDITTAKMGQEITIIVTPEDGYRIKEGTFKYKYGSTSVSLSNSGTAKINMREYNITIEVEIEPIED